jgi:hypothetical protein
VDDKRSKKSKKKGVGFHDDTGTNLTPDIGIGSKAPSNLLSNEGEDDNIVHIQKELKEGEKKVKKAMTS